MAQAKELECNAETAEASTRTNMWTPTGDKAQCYFGCERCTTEAPPTTTTTPEPVVDDGKPVLFNSSKVTVDNQAVSGDIQDFRRRMTEAQEGADNDKAACMGDAGAAFTATADAALALQSKTNKDAAQEHADSVEEAAKEYDGKITAGLGKLDAIEKTLVAETNKFNDADEQAKEALAKQGLAAKALTSAESSGNGSCNPHHPGLVNGADSAAAPVPFVPWKHVVFDHLCAPVNVASLYGRIPSAHQISVFLPMDALVRAELSSTSTPSSSTPTSSAPSTWVCRVSAAAAPVVLSGATVRCSVRHASGCLEPDG